MAMGQGWINNNIATQCNTWALCSTLQHGVKLVKRSQYEGKIWAQPNHDRQSICIVLFSTFNTPPPIHT